MLVLPSDAALLSISIAQNLKDHKAWAKAVAANGAKLWKVYGSNRPGEVEDRNMVNAGILLRGRHPVVTNVSRDDVANQNDDSRNRPKAAFKCPDLACPVFQARECC